MNSTLSKLEKDLTDVIQNKMKLLEG